ncbi:MAG: Smr/MutS family protein, partial [Clostridia bacterium]
TYRLLIGVPGKSNALYISKRLGLGDEIVENAKRFIQHEQNDYEKIILSLEKDRQRMEKEKIKALEHTREIRLLKEETQKELNKMNHERNKVLDAARKEARELIGKATRQSKEILDEIQELRKDGHVLSNAREEAEFRKKINDAQSLVQKSDFESVRIQQEFPIVRKSDLKLGDCVKIVHLNQNANIISISDKSDELVVQAGIMKLNVKLSDLVLVEEKSKVPPAASHGVRKPNFSLELDIRGNTIDEASDKIERFLDDAYLSGIMEVQIIHGKGTGALRAGVHDILKTNIHVQSYRLGKYGEGETGVTVVTLN